jgi:SNF2 family DNA or RNA helicase
MMFYDPERNLIVYDAPALAEVEGAMALGDYVAFEGTLRNLQTLHKLGQPIPAPLDYQYDWPGKFTPFEAQKVTSNFAVVNPHCCIFNDTGTGKTCAALWAADYLMRLYESAGRRLRWLILAPLSTLDVVWADEIFKLFFSQRKYAVVYGDAKKREKQLALDVDFYIANYAVTSIKSVAAELQARQDIQGVIIDEASAYKHHNTARHKEARLLLGWRQFLWLMTATPTPNGPENAYGLAKLVNNAGGESFRSYQDRVMFSVGPWKRVPRLGAHEDALKLMSPAVRFKIEDCMDLPECTVQRREVPLSVEQAKAYKELERDAQLMMKDGSLVNAANQAVLRMKLIQIVCGAVYDGGHVAHEVDATPRIAVLREVIEQCNEKVIVFAPLSSVVEMLYAKFREEFSCAVVNGETTSGQRKTIFDGFQHGDQPRVIFADPGTMAHGLTLTAATAIVWYGATDKTELYLQGNKRIHRPGQVNTTTIIQIASTPVEHEIYRRLQMNETMLGAILKLVEEQR